MRYELRMNMPHGYLSHFVRIQRTPTFPPTTPTHILCSLRLYSDGVLWDFGNSDASSKSPGPGSRKMDLLTVPEFLIFIQSYNFFHSDKGKRIMESGWRAVGFIDALKSARSDSVVNDSVDPFASMAI
eukprot:sb/3475394/